jgi:exonuclease-1
MGIQGLLQALKPLIEITHISTLKGKRVAIDGYCWLHKAVYGCALELCLKQQSDLWIKYCLSYIDLLLQHGIQVTIVFDGAPLPAKQKTEEEREENRQKNMQIAKDYYSKNDLKNARNYFARAIDITPQMAAELIQVVESSRPSVKFLVSPHEADAQLAFLSRNELVDVIITEDSDTIAYGCKDIVFKLNRDGSCERLIVNDVFTKFIDSKFDLRTFTPEMFLAMCIFSGCDYLESLPGIGLKTSYKMMVKHR